MEEEIVNAVISFQRTFIMEMGDCILEWKVLREIERPFDVLIKAF